MSEEQGKKNSIACPLLARRKKRNPGSGLNQEKKSTLAAPATLSLPVIERKRETDRQKIQTMQKERSVLWTKAEMEGDWVKLLERVDSKNHS